MRKFIDVQSIGPAVAGLSLLLTGFGATPAAAQFYGVPYNTPEGPPAFGRPAPVFRGYDRPLPPDEIVERLEDRGFEEVGRPRFDGQNYVVEAVNPRGLRVRLVIDAFRGHVIDRLAVDRGPAGRDDDEPLFGPRPDQPRFGNNAPLSPVPPPGYDGRSARIDPPGSVETAPLASPSARPERSLPAPRDPALAPRSPSDKAASVPRPVKPAASAVEGGNPDILKGEQRKPVASVPHSTSPAPTPVAPPATQAAVAPQPTQPAQPDIVAAKPDVPKADALSPIKPLKPQVAPDSATLNAEPGRSPEKTVRVISGVTPVPAPATGGPITADSNDVKP